MQLSARARRPVVIAVVVTGAVASIATTLPWAELKASLQLPPVQLSQAHPAATYRLRASGKGSAADTRGEISIRATSTLTAPVPMWFRVNSGYSPDQVIADFEGTSGFAFTDIKCSAFPCSDDVLVHIELRPRANGTWPEPGEWTISADLQLDIPGSRDAPAGTSATLELVP